MKGYIQVYTGDGKGKTTAAFGLALRAVGAGKTVFFAQFAKGSIYSEIKALARFSPDITIKQYGLKRFIIDTASEEDLDSARKGFDEISLILRQAEYDMIVLDEANIAIFFDLISVDEFIQLLKQKKEETEIIITGRYADPRIIEMADLVTDMKEVKHYYLNGVEARKGIEY
jgi:cob(I)alamin adenosyltransferase